jgi:membrane protein DedA with SNARE-associated domain
VDTATTARKEQQTMIWLSTVSLVIGALLARHFTVIALAPATMVIVVASIAIGQMYSTDIWSMVSTITVASVGIQIGYFVGILILNNNLAFFQKRAPSSDKKNARLHSVFRTPASR